MNRLRLNIGPRLVLCFALIIVLMFAGDVIVLWQFHIVQAQAARLDEFDEELVTVLRIHSDVLKLRDTLESLVNARNSDRLKTETQTMTETLAEDMGSAKSALSAVHSDNASADPAILPTLAVVQSNLQSETASVIDLAETTMGELCASLAHEINQPISGAITNASTCLRRLDREPPDIEGARAGAALIIRDANRAAEIINRVRLFFRKGVVTKERVNINELIREMEILLHNEASQHSVFVQTRLAADHPLIVADRVQLQQVLMNLMINGIDAMKAVEGPRQLTLGTQNDGNAQLLVSVEDTGIGLPANQAGQIFNAFFTTKEHGTGMGLRISRTIIEAHGGRLWVTDNHPRGASFHFTLAVSSDAASLDAQSNS
jgi:C4-dicarboxylate-specific signal transduction histidine kinase